MPEKNDTPSPDSSYTHEALELLRTRELYNALGKIAQCPRKKTSAARKIYQRNLRYKKKKAERRQATDEAIRKKHDVHENLTGVTLEISTPLRIIRRKRNGGLEAIFQTFHRIGFKRSGIVVVLDDDTGELVFAARATLKDDLLANQNSFADFQKVFTYFKKDQGLHQRCNSNGAAGQNANMWAIGWRKSQTPGEISGTYVPKSQYRFPGTSKIWLDHTAQASEIHKTFGERFMTLTPIIQQSVHEQLQGLGQVALGFDVGDPRVTER
ncbi:hypothetical protein EX30DRAFT_344214 [Ascodesmis nigricans]|uniref:Tet-like 2OG-Fe(II) oxygenase domain-containing protein n=1 Tax=Ascodesmis nigricans TaxID=341454 RepID=A0A4S2MJZ9_9PEZI|nr:hypothetical protein EX30DRAFT_344214 [Ascodesmis nigricans]